MELDINNPENIKQLIATLQALLPKDSNSEDQPKEEQNNIKTKKSKSGKKNTDNSQNKFLDMPEKNMYKADSKIDKKLNKYPPTPRNRPYQSIDVRCRVCGKTESINPKILPDSADRYKCNRCSSTSGA
jgi:hypothetical protein